MVYPLQRTPSTLRGTHVGSGAYEVKVNYWAPFTNSGQGFHSVAKDMKVTIDPGDIKNKITEINDSQSTLDKNFTFKTHSGSVISVKGQGYGWALDVDKETTQIQSAFENGE